MSNFDSTKRLLADLLRDIVAGKIQLPDFQRGWVWRDQGIRSLLVSIARAFPVGAVMMLENGGATRFKLRPIEGLDTAAIKPEDAEQLILDGQQRLTSLTQVLMLDKPVETYSATGKPLKRYYYINIDLALAGEEYYDEAFVGVDENRVVKENFGRDIKLDLSTTAKEYENFHFPCNQILNADNWEHGLFTHAPDKFARYMDFRTRVLKQFCTYSVPIIELSKSNSKEAVCLVFEKVNTGGVPLDVFELVTATYAADGVNLRDEWYGNAKYKIKGIYEELSSEPLLKNVQSTEFLQGLTLLYTFEKRQKDLAEGKTGKQVTGVSAKREAVLSLPLAAYQQWKDKLLEGFLSAAQFLHQEAFLSTRDLPYSTQLVPLATVLTLLGQGWRERRIYEKLAQWYWCGVLGELYGGAVETRMALDVQELSEWAKGRGQEPSTVRDANFQPARLETLRSRNSAAYKGISVLVQREGAEDLFWKAKIRTLDDTDIHHIFPKKWCESKGIPSSRYNSILNKTPISYKANRMIGGKAPSDYLKQLQQHQYVQLDDTSMDAIMATHAIDPTTLRNDDFDGFIATRKRDLLHKIEKAMGKAIIPSDEGVPEDESDED